MDVAVCIFLYEISESDQNVLDNLISKIRFLAIPYIASNVKAHFRIAADRHCDSAFWRAFFNWVNDNMHVVYSLGNGFRVGIPEMNFAFSANGHSVRVDSNFNAARRSNSDGFESALLLLHTLSDDLAVYFETSFKIGEDGQVRLVVVHHFETDCRFVLVLDQNVRITFPDRRLCRSRNH